MDGLRTPFFDALLQRHPDWRSLPLTISQSDPRSGIVLIVPAPPGSDLADGLFIDDYKGEITIELDHSHIHLQWPPHPDDKREPVWRDALAFIDAVLAEDVIASSGWIDGQLRMGFLHDATRVPDLFVPNLEYVRVRSWCGTHDKDQSSAETG